MKDLVWFSEIDKNDTALVGGKGANLGELYKIGAPVPNGFIITAQAYFRTLEDSGAIDKIKGILFNLDVENPALLADKALACQKVISGIKLDPKLESQVNSYYNKLTQSKNKLVAVRSSATAEDLPEASFAGQQKTFLNISGTGKLQKAVLDGWASLFEARAIYYRVQKGFDHFKVGIALPVQLMVESDVSGVMFTIDPVTNAKKIVIEAIFGLGELIVSGQVTPDHYEVAKDTFEIIARNIVSQDKQLVRGAGGNKEIKIAKAYKKSQKLSDQKIIELAKIGSIIEKHYFWPQDIEWAYKDSKLYIVQTRPVTTTGNKEPRLEKKESADLEKAAKVIILQGAPASPALASGPVVIIKSAAELSKVQKGMVLVTEMTNPDFVPAMKRASAIVTDRGGRTSHAAIVSRELGIACVVGTGNATKKLKNGQVVTVDGAKGIVYNGALNPDKKNQNSASASAKVPPRKTATKLYVNLAEPDLAPKVAARNVDGVGLLRAEFILAQIGTHPKKFIKDGKEDIFVDRMAGELTVFAKAFGSRPVIYRASDLKSNEYRNLAGGDMFEPNESNPMLGYRGAFRYIKDPETFKLELDAIKKVRRLHKNLHLMIPFVRSPQELQNVKELVSASGLFEDKHFKFWMMAEIPTNVISLSEFIKIGIDGISIGSNDLTMLILGTDRDNEEVASEFNELDPSVLWALEHLIKTCVKEGITSSICGQAPSIYPELTQKLVSWGITSVSVNPDAIESTRRIIAGAEHKLVSKS
ncbi:MAG: phosphoenolpyruvate synthase [Candidatus Curtissbacteria bacterium]|nr:phosphoenolpyruvate synthase [Candidatus Curtissbacteria bacterium]